MDKLRSSAIGARSTSQMTLDERRDYIAKLRTERQERFGAPPSSRPISSQVSRSTDDIKRDFSPKELRRSDLQSTSPTSFHQPAPTSMLGMHNTFHGGAAPQPSTSTPTFPSSASPVLSNANRQSMFSSSSNAPLDDKSFLRNSFTAPNNSSNYISNNNNNNNFNNSSSTFLSSQAYDTKQGLGGSTAFSSSFAIPPPDMQSSALETKQNISSAQRGYNQWAEEKMKWWDSESKRLQTFLSQLDEEWERHREATRRELEDEISALKHESLVRSNINQASKNLM